MGFMPGLKGFGPYDTHASMGSDTSKVARSAATHDAEQSRPQAVPLPPANYVNGMAPNAREDSPEPSRGSPNDNSPGGSTAAWNTLKRSRAEFEGDGYRPNRRSRSRTPPYSTRNTRIDHYSPRAARLAASTSNTRHSFIPDRGDKWSPDLDRRHEPSARSPNAVYRHSRPDSWSPPMRRPSPVKRPSQLRQPSPTKRDFSNPSDRHITEMDSSPQTQDSESGHLPRFGNLSWKRSSLPPRQNSDVVVPRTSATLHTNGVISPDQATPRWLSNVNVPEKVKFNGIEGVPKGPKRGGNHTPLSPRLERALPLVVGEEIKQQPHIFITTKSLPAKKATVKHLQGCLSKFVRKESDIAVDQSGYYLLFEDTVNGHKRLKLCYNTKCGEKLFSQYSLDMVCRPGGVTNTDGAERCNPVDSYSAPSPSSNAVAGAQAFPDGIDLPQQSDPTPGDQKGADLRSVEPELATVTSIKARSRTEIAFTPLRSSSPLRVPSRQDKEGTPSSNSGFTGSDISTTKQLKCHVCKDTQLSDADSLIQCSSCPRRYHRRCHNKPRIPFHFELNQSWQCRRCLQKQVQPKSRLSNASLASSISLAPSVGQLEEPPTKKPRLSDAVPVRATDVRIDEATPTMAGAMDSSIKRLHHIESRIELSGDSTNGFHIRGDTSVNDEDMQFDEAENLVEKSFSASVLARSGGTTSYKPARPTFVRKKISQAAERTTDRGSEVSAIMAASALPELYAAEADINPRENDEVQMSKRKSHKWSGVGADRQIIQAGTDTLLPLNNSFNNSFKTPEACARAGVSQVERPAFSPVTRVEVPDSPKVSHASLAHRERADKDAHSRKGTAIVKLKVRLKDPTLVSDQRDQQQDSTYRTVPAQRMKPSSPAVDKCTRCGKTIAFNPSGNKLCSRCKKNMPADAGTTITRPAGSSAIRTEEIRTALGELGQDDRGPQHITETAALENASSGNLAAAVALQAPQMFLTPQSRQNKERTMCVPCRKHRRLRCIHKKPILVERIAHVQPTQKSPGAAPQQIEDNAQPQDDLDLWNQNFSPRPAQAHSDPHAQTTESNKIGDPTPQVEIYNSLTERVSSSSSLSPLPRDGILASPTKSQTAGKKRQSHTTVATSQFDLGDSFVRPKNTYIKLIGMALCAAPGNKLKSQEIVSWVAKNIPNYVLGKGNKWENGISATLSMKQQRAELGICGLWKKIGEDGAKKNQACWYALHSEQVDKMLHWDPVLKEPVSPGGQRQDRRRDSEDEEHVSEDDDIDAARRTPQHAQAVMNGGPTIHTGSVPKNGQEAEEKFQSAQAGSDPMDVDDSDEDVVNQTTKITDKIGEVLEEHMVESSDDEPIASSRRKDVNATTQASFQSLEQPTNSSVPVDIDLDGPHGPNSVIHSKPAITAVGRSTRPVVIHDVLSLSTCDSVTLAQRIKADAEHVDFSAKSLFDEWPEYDPVNQLDKEAKLAEIKKRPTRKQKLGQNSQDPWLEWNPTPFFNRTVSVESSRSSFTLEKTSRSTRNAAADSYYPWENGETNVKHFDNLETLIQDIMPITPIPIIHEGRIAYRDGTRNEFDGTLPRAKHIYKTGYA